MYPSLLGGSSWYPPAYSPRTGLYYVSYRIRDETIYRAPEELDLSLGRQFLGGWARRQGRGRNTGGLRAIDGATGNIVWERMYSGLPTKAALLATAADLLFTVDGDLLYALDTGTGEELWKIRLGGDVEMGPITYLYQGKQQLALIARGSLSVLDLVD
jgi:alcohol dehydrogenase (cytochrome c)